MNVSSRPTGTPFKAFMLLCCLAAVLAVTPARASVVEIPATITGYAYRGCDDVGNSWYGKSNGYLQYGAFVGSHTAYKWNAFLKFSLDSLPDTCVLSSAELGYYQYDHSNGLPEVNIKLIRDPVPLGADDLFWEIERARALTPYVQSPDGWVAWSFDSAALALFDSCSSAGWVSLAVHGEYFGDERIGNAYGYDSSPPPRLRVVYIGPNETDIQALHAELATYPLSAQRYDTALLTLTNRGFRTSGAFWVYASSPGLGLESTLVGPITASETVSVRLPLPAPSEKNTYVSYSLFATEPNDPWHVNDTTQLRCWAFPAGTYAAEGFDEPAFPPPGWVIVNNDSGTKWWDHWTAGGYCHSGGGSTICVGEARNDDWLIAGPVCPTADDRDSLGFFRRSYNPSPPTALEVWAMRESQVADTLRRLWASSVADTVYSRVALSLDSLDGDTIWIGFRCRTSGTANALFLDDIWFSRVYVPGTCEPQGSVARQPELAFAPNPATGRFITVRYALTAGTRGRLTLRDVLGRTARTFVLDNSGSVRLDLRGFAPGVYMATLDAAGLSVARKLILTAPR